MNIGLSTAKWLAPTSWLFNFVCQQYGMNSSPDMKQVADKYHAMFSPQPYGIGAFFLPQAAIQLYWLYKLYRKQDRPASNATGKGSGSDDEAVRYAPFFILGNVCIGIWMMLWNNERLDLSNIAVCINSFSQLFYVMTLLPPMTSKNALTHIVAKMFAGIGLLDFLDNTASGFFVGKQPGTMIFAATLLGSVLATGMSDAIMGSCIVYDLVILALGQSGTWQQVLWLSSGLSGLLTAYKIYTNYGFVEKLKGAIKDE